MNSTFYTPPEDRIPTRLKIIKAIQGQLESIERASGEYCFDVQSFVRGRTLVGADTKYPAIAILESPSPDFARFAGAEWGGEASAEWWTLLIQGMVKNDSEDNLDAAYYFAADTVKCLSRVLETKSSNRPKYPQEWLFGGTVTALQIAPPVVRGPEKSVSGTATFFLAIRVGVAGMLDDPYTSLV